ncbi:hypothetical protein V8C37DRAFT_370159 [Trichoderma ceciliae]
MGRGDGRGGARCASTRTSNKHAAETGEGGEFGNAGRQTLGSGLMGFIHWGHGPERPETRKVQATLFFHGNLEEYRCSTTDKVWRIGNEQLRIELRTYTSPRWARGALSLAFEAECWDAGCWDNPNKGDALLSLKKRKGKGKEKSARIVHVPLTRLREKQNRTRKLALDAVADI